jgi:hypothetical protein
MLKKTLQFNLLIGSSLTTLTSTALKQYGIPFEIPPAKVARQAGNSWGDSNMLTIQDGECL